MKDLIVLCVMLPLLIVFILLIAHLNVNASNENFVKETVYMAEQQAKLDGCFTADNIDGVKSKIGKKMQLEKDEIEIVADMVPTYRNTEFNEKEMIKYKVIVPIKKVVPANKLFGIADEKNKGEIVVEGKLASERLQP